MKKWVFLLLGAMLLAVACQSAQCAQDPVMRYRDRLIGKKYVSQLYQLSEGETQAVSNMADRPYIEFIDSDTCIFFGGRPRDAAVGPDFVPYTNEMHYTVNQEFGTFILRLNDDYSMEWQIGLAEGAPLFSRFGDQIPGFNGILIEEKFAVSPDEITPDGRIGRIWGYTPNIVYPAGDGYLAFRTPDTGWWGYAKTSGEVVLSPDFGGVTPDKKQISPNEDLVPMPATTRTVVVNDLKEDPYNHHLEYQMYSLLDGAHLLDMSQYDDISAFSVDGILAARKRDDNAATSLGDMVQMDIIDDKGNVLKTIDQYYPYTEKGQNIISEGIFPVRRYHEWGTDNGCDELALMTTDGAVVQPSLQNPEVGLARIVDNYFRFQDNSQGIRRPQKGDVGPGQYEFEVCEMAPFADARDKTPVSVDFYWSGGEWEDLDIDNNQAQCIGVMDRQGVVTLFESPINSNSSLDKDISDQCFDDAFLTGSMIFDYEGHCRMDADDLGSFQDENVYGIRFLGDGCVGVCTSTGGNSYDYWLLNLKGEVLAGPVPTNLDDLSFDISKFSEGYCPAFDKAKGQWGYIDAYGNWAIPAAYDSAWSFEDGRAVVNDSVIIDRSGSIIWDWKTLAGSVPEGGLPLTPPIETVATPSPSPAGGLAGRRFECDKMADGQPIGEGASRPFIQFTDGSICTATTSLSQLHGGGGNDYQMDYLVQGDKVYVTDGDFPMISFIIGNGILTREPLTIVAIELEKYSAEYREVSESVPPAPHLSVSAGTVNGLFAGTAGGQGMTINVTSNANWSVSVVEGTDWISLSDNGGNGDESFHTVIAPNDGPERIGCIEVSAPGCETIEIKVTQSAAPPRETSSCNYIKLENVDQNGLVVGPEGGQGMTARVSCNAKWHAEVVKGSDWIQIDASSGSGDGAFTPLIGPNPLAKERTGILRVVSEGCEPVEIRVSQAAAAQSIAEQKPGVSLETAVALQNQSVRFRIEAKPGSMLQLYVNRKKINQSIYPATGETTQLDRAFSTAGHLAVQFTMIYGGAESQLSDPVALTVQTPAQKAAEIGLEKPRVTLGVQSVQQNVKVGFTVRARAGSMLQLYVNGKRIQGSVYLATGETTSLQRCFSTTGRLNIQFSALYDGAESERSDAVALMVLEPAQATAIPSLNGIAIMARIDGADIVIDQGDGLELRSDGEAHAIGLWAVKDGALLTDVAEGKGYRFNSSGLVDEGGIVYDLKAFNIYCNRQLELINSSENPDLSAHKKEMLAGLDEEYVLKKQDGYTFWYRQNGNALIALYEVSSGREIASIPIRVVSGYGTVSGKDVGYGAADVEYSSRVSKPKPVASAWSSLTLKQKRLWFDLNGAKRVLIDGALPSYAVEAFVAEYQNDPRLKSWTAFLNGENTFSSAMGAAFQDGFRLYCQQWSDAVDAAKAFSKGNVAAVAEQFSTMNQRYLQLIENGETTSLFNKGDRNKVDAVVRYLTTELNRVSQQAEELDAGTLAHSGDALESAIYGLFDLVEKNDALSNVNGEDFARILSDLVERRSAYYGKEAVFDYFGTMISLDNVFNLDLLFRNPDAVEAWYAAFRKAGGPNLKNALENPADPLYPYVRPDYGLRCVRAAKEKSALFDKLMVKLDKITGDGNPGSGLKAVQRITDVAFGAFGTYRIISKVHDYEILLKQWDDELSAIDSELAKAVLEELANTIADKYALYVGEMVRPFIAKGVGEISEKAVMGVLTKAASKLGSTAATVSAQATLFALTAVSTATDIASWVVDAESTFGQMPTIKALYEDYLETKEALLRDMNAYVEMPSQKGYERVIESFFAYKLVKGSCVVAIYSVLTSEQDSIRVKVANGWKVLVLNVGVLFESWMGQGDGRSIEDLRTKNLADLQSELNDELEQMEAMESYFLPMGVA